MGLVLVIFFVVVFGELVFVFDNLLKICKVKLVIFKGKYSSVISGGGRGV